MSTLFAFTHGRGVWRVPLGTGSPCSYSLSDRDFAVANYGGDLVLNVSTRQDCVWSVVPLSGKAVPLVPTTGSGNAAVRIHVPLNNTPNAQSAGGSLAVGDQLVTYRQMAPVTISSPTNVSPQTAVDVPALPYVVYEPANQSTFTGSPGPVHTCTGTADNRSLWFRYVASFTGTLQATVAERGDLTPLYDSVLTAYTGSTSAGDELACDHRSNGTVPYSQIQFPVAQGQSYLVEVSYFGAKSSGGLPVIALSQVK
jgi:hypothetical protein